MDRFIQVWKMTIKCRMCIKCRRCKKPIHEELTHFRLDKMASISQMTFSRAFSWMESCVFLFHWSFFSWGSNWQRVNIGSGIMAWRQMLPNSMTHICGTRGKWVNSYQYINSKQQWLPRTSRRTIWPNRGQRNDYEEDIDWVWYTMVSTIIIV